MNKNLKNKFDLIILVLWGFILGILLEYIVRVEFNYFPIVIFILVFTMVIIRIVKTHREYKTRESILKGISMRADELESLYNLRSKELKYALKTINRLINNNKKNNETTGNL